MPVAWWNDFGGVTLGVRQRSNYLGRYDRGLVFGSVGTRAGATERIGFSGRWSNPIGHLAPRTETSLAAWAVEGRAGVALSVDRSLRRHLGFGADPHVGFDVLWMATTDLGYLDRHPQHVDRKSTRLNSSHSQISYAVFCLKKKKKKKSV